MVTLVKNAILVLCKIFVSLVISLVMFYRRTIADLKQTYSFTCLTRSKWMMNKHNCRKIYFDSVAVNYKYQLIVNLE